MSDTISLSGLREFRDQIRSMKDQIDKAINESLIEEAEKILAEAKESAPVVSGELRDSGKITEVYRLGEMRFVSIVFDAPYAVYVHESSRQYKRKFLEQPLNRSVSSLGERVKDKIGI